MQRYKEAWPHPCVQVVDLQRYPQEVEETTPAPSLFYVAVSDAESLLWLLVPPGTEMEELVASYQIDVGCCVTLRDYAVVTAANGYNVLVLLRVDYSPNPLSLIGHPRYDANLFQLSPRALTLSHRDSGNSAKRVEDAAAAAAEGKTPYGEEIVLRDLVERPECAMKAWWVTLRILWKSDRPYHGDGESDSVRVRNEGRGGGGALSPLHGSSTSTRSLRCMQRYVGVDANGNAMLCVFWYRRGSLGPLDGQAAALADAGNGHDGDGGEGRDDTSVDGLRVGHCVQLHRGQVRWGAGEAVVPGELQFHEDALVKVLLPSEEPPAFPSTPSAFLGRLGENMRTVQEILEGSHIDDVVAVTARVRDVGHKVPVNTKRGRVTRVVVCVEDARSADAVTYVTLWGDLAESVCMAAGELWFFSSCTVREFMRVKQLSVRASAVVLLLEPAATHAVADAGSLVTTPPRTGEVLEGRSTSLSLVRAATAAEDAGVATSEAAPEPVDGLSKPTVQLALCLHDAAQTMPVLVRIQSVTFPLLRERCTRCWWVSDAATPSGHGGDSQAVEGLPCARCGEATSRPVFSFTVVLSDGCECTEAHCLDGVGESLLEVSAQEFSRRLLLLNPRSVEASVTAALLGTPVLAWLFADPTTHTRTVIRCTHVNVRLCAQILMSILDKSVLSGDTTAT